MVMTPFTGHGQWKLRRSLCPVNCRGKSRNSHEFHFPPLVTSYNVFKTLISSVAAQSVTVFCHFAPPRPVLPFHTSLQFRPRRSICGSWRCIFGFGMSKSEWKCSPSVFYDCVWPLWYYIYLIITISLCYEGREDVYLDLECLNLNGSNIQAYS